MKIYTRTGDQGQTSLFGGTRVAKDDARVEAYGEVDETNACLGFARALLAAHRDSPTFSEILDALTQIQSDLLALGALLADPSGTVSQRMPKAALVERDVERLEKLIDRLEADLPPLTHFVLAGGLDAGAALHVARAVCRRAERRMVALEPAVDGVLLRYVNRLSDLLFVMARWINHRAGVPEVQW